METLNVEGWIIHTTRPRVRDWVTSIPNHKADCPNSAYRVVSDFMNKEGEALELVTCNNCQAIGCYKL